MSNKPDFAAMVGSRICHDLISPVGAIGNGLELIALTGDPKGPEMQMIEESVQNANARIRLFRVAFGHPGAKQTVGEAEIISILQDLSPSSRTSTYWEVEGPVPRPELRLAFLTLMCFENALPFGGTLAVTKSDDMWVFVGESEKLRVDNDLWGPMSQGQCPTDLVPAKVQFGLLPEGVAHLDRQLKFEQSDGKITLSF